jgi:hypothetical protein
MQIYSLAVILLVLTINIKGVIAQDTSKCEGPPEICAQIQELQGKLKAVEESKKGQEKAISEMKTQEEEKNSNNMIQAMAMAAALASGLKLLLSSLKKWRGYFKTGKQKAILQIVTIAVGVAAFFATNVGLGMPFWMSLIVAGGGPGAMVLHDLQDLVMVLIGKKKFEEVEKTLQDKDGDLKEDTKSENSENKEPENKEETTPPNVA